MECAMVSVKVVWPFGSFMSREYSTFAPVSARDIGSLALDQVTCEPNPESIVIESADSEARVKQPKQPLEGRLIPAVGRGGQENEVALLILGQAAQEFESLLTPLVCAYTGVCLIHHDGIGAGAGKAVATLVGLDIVQANHRDRVSIEEGL